MESFKKIIEIIKAMKKTFNKWKQKKIVWYAVNLQTIMQFILVVIMFVAGNVLSSKESNLIMKDVFIAKKIWINF